MRPIIHMCGYALERSDHPQGAFYNMVGEQGSRTPVVVQTCPQCGESLCDTESREVSGEPIFIPNQSDWSIQRRKELGW